MPYVLSLIVEPEVFLATKVVQVKDMERESKKKHFSIYGILGVHKNVELDFPDISLLFAVARNIWGWYLH